MNICNLEENIKKLIYYSLEFRSETLKVLEFYGLDFQKVDFSFMSRLECLEQLKFEFCEGFTYDHYEVGYSTSSNWLYNY